MVKGHNLQAQTKHATATYGHSNNSTKSWSKQVETQGRVEFHKESVNLQGILFLQLICQGFSWHLLPAFALIDCRIICLHCVGEAWQLYGDAAPRKNAILQCLKNVKAARSIAAPKELKLILTRGDRSCITSFFCQDWNSSFLPWWNFKPNFHRVINSKSYGYWWHHLWMRVCKVYVLTLNSVFLLY